MPTSYKNATGTILNLSGTRTNTILGTALQERFTGTSGNDAMRGYGGNDTYAGGLGDDVYFLSTAGDTVIEAAGQGVDSVHVTFKYTLTANVEHLYLDGSGAIYGEGNALDNVIIGSADNQTLNGGAGNDVLVGGGKNAIFIQAKGTGSDAIEGWDATDHIRLDGYGLTTFDQVKSLLKQVGADTELNFSNGEKLVLRNVQASTLTANNFNLSLDTSKMRLTFGDDFNTLVTKKNGGFWVQETQLKPAQAEFSIEPTYKGTSNTALGINPYSVSDGVLTITASPTPDYAKQYLKNAGYVSGTMNTFGTFSQEYGYFEIRAQMSAGNGLWPAFWLLPADGSWPPELDVFEQLGKDPSTLYLSAHDKVNGKDVVTTTLVNVDTTQWHTYGADWEPDYITYYIDGIAVAKQATPASMNKEMYMIANLSVGDNGWVGTYDSTTGTGTFKIDYIRAFATSNTVSTTINGVHTVYGTSNPAVPVTTTAPTVDTAVVTPVVQTVTAVTTPLTQVVGTAAAETLAAASNGAELWGYAGNDILNAKTFTAVLHGGEGNDTYYVNAAGQTVQENAGEGTDMVYSAVSFTMADNVEILALSGTANINGTGNNGGSRITGNAGNNTITGGNGTDVLDGGASGLDTLVGGKGNDTYFVNHIGTTLVELAGEGTDLVYSTISWTLADNIETLVLSGAADINGTGNDGGVRIVGNTGANIIVGGAGVDSLDGGTAGNDTLIGSKGDDTYWVNHAGTTLIEKAGEGNDTVHSTISWTLGDNFETLALDGTANINGTGNALANRLIGNSGANVLNGGGGADTLTGGAGRDTFAFGSGFGKDIVTDFTSADDYLQFTGFSRAQMHVTQVGSNVVIDFGGADSVTLLNAQANDANLLGHILF